MLRRNLLKSLTALIPISFLGKNAIANENSGYITEIIVKNKSGKPIRLDRSDGFWCEYTYNQNGKELSYKDSNGLFSKSTYDENNNQLTYETSKGYWYKSTYDQNGNKLTYKDSTGKWFEQTYNEKGQILGFKDNEKWIVYAEDSDGNTWEQSRWTYNV